jgi:hypothetical protein
MDISIVVLSDTGYQLNSFKFYNLAPAEVTRALGLLENTFKRPNTRYEFSKIKVGEAVHYPNESSAKLMAAAYMYARRTDKKFSCRQLSSQAILVTRIK